MDNHEAYGAWKGKGSILKGITWLQGYSIVVCNSPDIEHELNNYEWAVKENTPIDKYNHALDSIRYAVSWYKMNIVRE
jgi:phage terminase large subunit